VRRLYIYIYSHGYGGQKCHFNNGIYISNLDHLKAESIIFFHKEIHRNGQILKSPEEVSEKIRLMLYYMGFGGNISSIYIRSNIWIRVNIKKETWGIGQGPHVLGIACNFGH
jgi:hypothetical protein